MADCRPIKPAGVKPPKGVRSASWIVADLDTGEVLAAKDPHGRHRPASLIKMLLALVVVSKLPMDKVLTATAGDARQECTCIGIRPHQRYRVRNVLTAMLMRSGNDTAHMLGNALGGQKAAMAQMNALAHKIGALDTHASSVSGLDAPGMMTSAYDLGLIFRWAMKQPVIAKAVRTKTFMFRTRAHKPPEEIINDNRNLGTYRGFLGGKTGYTDDARATYMGAASRGGHRLEVVLMRGESFPVHLSDQGARLLDYGFRLVKAHTPAIGVLDGKPHTHGKVTTRQPTLTTAPPTTTHPTTTAAPSTAHRATSRAKTRPQAVSEDSDYKRAGSAAALLVAGALLGAAGVLVLKRRRRG